MEKKKKNSEEHEYNDRWVQQINAMAIIQYKQ